MILEAQQVTAHDIYQTLAAGHVCLKHTSFNNSGGASRYVISTARTKIPILYMLSKECRDRGPIDQLRRTETFSSNPCGKKPHQAWVVNRQLLKNKRD